MSNYQIDQTWNQNMSQNDSDKEIKVNYVSEIIVLPHIKIVENSQEFDPTSREKVMTHANEAVILSSFPLEIKKIYTIFISNTTITSKVQERLLFFFR